MMEPHQDSKLNDFMKLVTEEKSPKVNKVLPLSEAIAALVRPGMKLHLGEGANAAIREIIRQFRDTSPEFVVITSAVRDAAIDLVHCNLVRTLIMSSLAETFPAHGPSPVLQRAYKEKRVEIENWSVFTIVQRLMAGALGAEFLPTPCIAGSSLAEGKAGSFLEIDDPFGSGRRVGLVRAIRPDVSLVHGLAADPQGYTILPPGMTAGDVTKWGALSSRKVIVTVEKIVPTSFIRKYSFLVKFPGYLVDSLSVCPLGAHPAGLSNLGVDELESYYVDTDFMVSHRKVSEKPGDLDNWLQEWVMSCNDHEDYLRKLGQERIALLKEKMGKEAWKSELLSSLSVDSLNAECGDTEIMIIVAARKVYDIAINKRYKLILAPEGTSALASYLAYYKAKKEGIDLELTTGTGMLGFEPRLGSPYLTDPRNTACKMQSDALHTYGVFVGGPHGCCLAVMGAGQIDKCGNINSTRIGDLYLTGGGGANDVGCASEIVVVATQSTTKFIEKVPYITCCGDKVKTIVSDKGVLVKDDQEFILTGYFANPKFPSKRENIENIRANCGWELKVSPCVEEIPRPSRDELTLLRLFDPKGYIIGGGR